MNRLLVLLMTCLVTAAVLAGCHEPTPTDGPGDDGTDDGTDGGDDAQDVSLTVTDAPNVVTANESFEVTVGVEADGTVSSSHFGAHWSFNSTADADTETLRPTDFDGGSPHVLTQTDIGETYTISNWTFGDDFAGKTIYFRAHVLSEGIHHWSDEQMFTIVPST